MTNIAQDVSQNKTERLYYKSALQWIMGATCYV